MNCQRKCINLPNCHSRMVEQNEGGHSEGGKIAIHYITADWSPQPQFRDQTHTPKTLCSFYVGYFLTFQLQCLTILPN